MCPVGDTRPRAMFRQWHYLVLRGRFHQRTGANSALLSILPLLTASRSPLKQARTTLEVKRGQVFPTSVEGASLVCATAPPNVGAATTNPCTIKYIRATRYFRRPIASLAEPIVTLYRISGFVFDAGGVGAPVGAIWFDNNAGSSPAILQGPAGLGGIRIDHNTFSEHGPRYSCAIFFGHNNMTGGAAAPVGHYYGVIDHNLGSTSDTIIFVQYIGYPDPSPPAER